jgi:hypothetical protein
MAHFPRNPPQPPRRDLNDPRSCGPSIPTGARSTLNDARSTRRRGG